MKKKLTVLLVTLVCMISVPVRAAVFTIADGDVSGLISVMEIAKSNNDVTNTIHLAVGGTYELSTVAELAFYDGFEFGALGLPATGEAKTLIIHGNHATIRRIDSAPNFRIFFVGKNASLTLNNLTVENGRCDHSGGGAVYVQYASTLSTNGCKFIHNTSLVKYGGAIYSNIYGTVTLTNTEFLENQAYNLGGATYSVLSDLTIENCLFKHNKTTAPTDESSGGAIFTDGGRIDVGNGTITIKDSKFEENEANINGESNAGGAIYLYGYNNNSIQIERCSIVNNRGKFYGAGIYLDTESEGVNNTVPNNVQVIIKDCLIAGNKTAGNQAINEMGGGLYISGASDEPIIHPTIRLINCTIVDNEAYFGGAIANFMDGLEIMNCTIANNKAFAAGAIFRNNPIHMNNTIIAYNTVTNEGGASMSCYKTDTGSNNIQYPVLGSHPNDVACTKGITFVDPLLGPLQDNGGPVFTRALLPRSPAINAGGSFELTPTTDARGVATIGRKDIGAFEREPTTTVHAGLDVALTLPTNQTILSGTASNPDGSIVGWAWTQISGPATATLTHAETPMVHVSDLVQGLYTFRLTVMDEENYTTSDEVTVNVIFSPIYLNTGSSETIQLNDKTFQADNLFPSYFSVSTTSENTQFSGIYKHERVSTTDLGGLTFNIPVPNGRYTLVTHHAELWFGYGGGSAGAGKRVFDIVVEGVLRKDNFDMHLEGLGANPSHQNIILTFENIDVRDGYLTLEMAASANRPSISALEIYGTNPSARMLLSTNKLAIAEMMSKSVEEAEEMILYPNPVKEELYINYKNTSNKFPIQVAIMDIMGRKVFEKIVDPNPIHPLGIGLGNLSSGMYQVIIQRGNFIKTYTIVKDN